MYLQATCISSLDKYLFKSSAYFFNWVLFPFSFFFFLIYCMSYVYILDSNYLLVISFANILFYSECCLFVLSMVSFDVQKFLTLIGLICLLSFILH